jgi:hypothetical protein
LDYVPAVPGDYTFTSRVKDNQTKRHSGDSAQLTFTRDLAVLPSNLGVQASLIGAAALVFQNA